MNTTSYFKTTLKEIFNQKMILTPQEAFRLFITSNEADLLLIDQLRNPKTTVCGKRIERSHLSFKCFDCAPCPNHMFCRSCFILEKHKGHRFIMTHRLGGCCDCGDERTIIKGSCDNHQGMKNNNMDQELQKVPNMLAEQIKNFLKFIIIYYVKNMQKSNLNYPLGLMRCKTMSKLIGLEYSKIDDILKECDGVMKPIKRHEFGAFLHDLCFSLIQWMIEFNMPFIILVTNLLIEIPAQELQVKTKFQTDDSFIDLIVKVSAVTDNGHIKTRKIEDILYAFHANETFKSHLQQSLIKKYDYLTIYQRKIQNISLQEITQFYDELIKIPAPKLELIKKSQNTQNELSRIINEYLVEFKLSKHQEPNIISEYVSDLFQQHNQYVSIEDQQEFFFSPYISTFYLSLKKSYNIITTIQCEEMGQICNQAAWLQIRIKYNFFSQIALKQLEKIMTPKNYFLLINGELSQQDFSIFGQQMQDFFLTDYLGAIGEQGSVDIKLIDLKKHEQQLYIQNYLYVQQFLLSVLFTAFEQIVITSKNKQLTINLTSFMLKYSFQLVQRRNLIDDSKVRQYLVNNEMVLAKQKRISRLFTVNATTTDRAFSYFLTAAYYKSGMSKDLFVDFLVLSLGQTKDEIMNQILQAVTRAIQSFIYAQAYQDNVNHIYNGLNTQVKINLKSLDTALIKIFLFLCDDEYAVKFSESLRGFSSDEDMYKHKLILDLLLTDQDLLNVYGSISGELPIDLKTYFSKFIRSLFVTKNYLAFTAIKSICAQAGMLNTLPLSDFVLEFCELDSFVRELRIKAQFHNNKIYEPYLFQHTHELKGNITESLLEKQNINIDPTFGNGIRQDFMYPSQHPLATMGPIRQNLWIQIFKSNLIFDDLFSQYLEVQNEQLIKRQPSKTMIYTIYAFVMANNTLHLLNENQLNILRTLSDKLKNIENVGVNKTTQTLVQQNENDKDTDFQVLEEAFSIEVQKDSTPSVTSSQNQQKLKKQKQMEKFQQKFQDKRDKFNQNFNIQDLSDITLSEKECVTCQGCKLVIEPKDDQCLPALLDYDNTSHYMDSTEQLQNNFDFKFTFLNTCKHRFHPECLNNISQNQLAAKLAPMWLQRQCPVCKQALNICVPVNLFNKSEQTITKAVHEYFEQTITFMNVNEHAAEHYFSKYTDTQDLNTRHYLIFIECNISIIHNIYLERYINQVDQSQDYELLANAIFITQFFVNHMITQEIQAVKIEESLQQIQQKYVQFDHFVARQVSLFLDSLYKNASLEKANKIKFNSQQIFIIAQKEDNFEEQFSSTLQIIYRPVSFEQKNNEQNLQQIQSPIKSNILQHHVDSIKNRIGTSFNDFYMKFMQRGCEKCCYYPLINEQNRTAELFVCLLCEIVLCPIKCDHKKQNKEVSNLNDHAQKFHSSQCIFISVTTGYAIITVCPITVLNYKNLFYDHLGQMVKILDPENNWESFKLDERELSSLVQILKNRTFKQVIRNNLDKEQLGFIDMRGRY